MSPVAMVQSVVAEHFGITVAEIVSPSRHAKLALARHVAIWITRTATALSLRGIGMKFGGRDYTSVIHAIQRVETAMAADKAFDADVRALLSRVADQLDGVVREAIRTAGPSETSQAIDGVSPAAESRWQTDARKAVLTQMFTAGAEAQRIRSRLAALPGPPPPPWPKVREYARRALKLSRPGGDDQSVDTAEDARIADQIRAASARFVEAGLKWAEQRRTETPARAG